MARSGTLRLPSIEGLRAFEAAARLGSHERAAATLAVTASAVGKRIATLEQLLGTPLFVRGAKPLQLSASGREYLQQAGAALALLAAMPQHQRGGRRAQTLRVVAPPTFARQILVPQLDAFTVAHPEIELEIVLSVPFLGGAAANADVEVRHGRAADTPGSRALLHDRVLPLAAPALLARLPPLRAPADLQLAPLLRTPIEPWTPWFRAAALPWPEPAGGPRFVDLGLTLEAAVAGQGVVLGRPSLARAWLRSGSLRPLFGTSVPAAGQYFLAPGAGAGAAALFADWLVAACAAVAREAEDAISGSA